MCMCLSMFVYVGGCQGGKTTGGESGSEREREGEILYVCVRERGKWRELVYSCMYLTEYPRVRTRRKRPPDHVHITYSHCSPLPSPSASAHSSPCSSGPWSISSSLFLRKKGVWRH